MNLLTDHQRQRAIDALREFLSAPPGLDGQTQIQAGEAWDQERVRVIEQNLNPLISGYLKGEVALSDFKSKVDSINKRHTFGDSRASKAKCFSIWWLM
jgi:hypothetical protein